ncbi:helix-turn-helix transcriptional regulator [Candidatus Bathyarchaeota archaeon]|nr:helix-turn-helix transcriptional regulator [Candidatus Bathyarchaeota archaeon]
MPRPVGTIGETKLKILAIIYQNELYGITSYGYNIWTTLKKKFRCYLDDTNLRNIYRHLKDLNEIGLVKKGISQPAENAPKRQLYSLTNNGRRLKQKFSRYLRILEETS